MINKFSDRIKPETLSLQWLVTSKEDIADFYLLMRINTTDQSPTAYEKIIPYNKRKEILTGKQIREYISGPNSTVPKNIQKKLLTSNNYELCLIGITSNGDLREWQNSQCRILKNFYIGNHSHKIQPSKYFHLFIFA